MVSSSQIVPPPGSSFFCSSFLCSDRWRLISLSMVSSSQIVPLGCVVAVFLTGCGSSSSAYCTEPATVNAVQCQIAQVNCSMADAKMNISQYATAQTECVKKMENSSLVCSLCPTMLKTLNVMNSTAWDNCRPFYNVTSREAQMLYDAVCAPSKKMTTIVKSTFTV